MVHFRFFHAADLHLDSPCKGLSRLPAPIDEAVRQSSVASFNRLIRFCIEKRVDFLCLSGDLYEAAEGRLAGQMVLQRGLWRLYEAGIHSFVIRGNHDPQDGPHAQLEWPPTAHLFSSQRVEGIPFRKGGQEVARVYGRSYPTARFQENILSEYRRDPMVPFAIAMHHTNVDGMGGHENYAPCRLSELVACGMDYWALGHVHKRQILHEAPWVVYPGNLQGRSMKEQGEKGGYLVEVRDGQVEAIQFVPLSEVIWQELEVDLTGAEAEEEMLCRIRAALAALQEELGGRAAMVRLVLQGMTTLASRLRNPLVLEDVLALLNDELNSQVGGKNGQSTAAWMWLDEAVNRTLPPFDRQTVPPFLREVLSACGRLRSSGYGQKPEELPPLKALWTHPAARRYLEAWTGEEWEGIFAEVESLLLSLLLSEREGGR